MVDLRENLPETPPFIMVDWRERAAMRETRSEMPPASTLPELLHALTCEGLDAPGWPELAALRS
jgi:hypothetical protein